MNPTTNTDYLKKQIETLQALIQTSDSLNESATIKQTELLEKLTGLVKELGAQNTLQAKLIARQNARLTEIESRQRAQEQAKINHESTANVGRLQQMNAEKYRKKEEFNDLAFKAFREYEQAQLCIDRLHTGGFRQTAARLLYPEGHFMNKFYREGSINSFGNEEHVYECSDRGQISYLVAWRDHYKDLHDKFATQRDAIL